MAEATMHVRQYLESSEWPFSARCLENTCQWLESVHVDLVLDFVELGQIAKLPGADMLQPEILAFLQSVADKCSDNSVQPAKRHRQG